MQGRKEHQCPWGTLLTVDTRPCSPQILAGGLQGKASGCWSLVHLALLGQVQDSPEGPPLHPPPPVKKWEPEALASPGNTVPPQGPLQGQLRTLGSEHSWTIGAHRAQRVLSGSDRFWELPL